MLKFQLKKQMIYTDVDVSFESTKRYIQFWSFSLKIPKGTDKNVKVSVWKKKIMNTNVKVSILNYQMIDTNVKKHQMVQI